MPPPPPPSATGTVGADVPPASGRGWVGGPWDLTWGRLRCQKDHVPLWVGAPANRCLIPFYAPPWGVHQGRKEQAAGSISLEYYDAESLP